MNLAPRNSLLRLAFVMAVACCVLACALKNTSLTTITKTGPRSEQCGECHVEIYKEWKTSAHARAWTSPAFVESTADQRIDACTPCHAPRTVFTNGEDPTARKMLREEGVSCVACHLTTGALHGPLETGALTPHAVSTQDPRYRESSFCGLCHKETFDAWSASKSERPDVKTCQQCHMPAVKRKTTQATGVFSKLIVALHDEHEMHRHTFAAPSLERPEGSVLFDARTVPEGLEVNVENRLPHPIPAGTFGCRHVRLTVVLENGEGEELQVFTRDFYRDLDTALSPGGDVVWMQAVDTKDAARATWRLEKMDAQGEALRVIAHGNHPLRSGAEQ